MERTLRLLRPIGLVFSAVTVPEADCTLLAGPAVMGDLQDTLTDLPDCIDRESVRTLAVLSAEEMNHVTSLLEIAGRRGTRIVRGTR